MALNKDKLLDALYDCAESLEAKLNFHDDYVLEGEELVRASMNIGVKTHNDWLIGAISEGAFDETDQHEEVIEN